MRLQIRILRDSAGAIASDQSGDDQGLEGSAFHSPGLTLISSASRGLPYSLCASLVLHVLAITVAHAVLLRLDDPAIDVKKELLAKSHVEPLLLKIPSRQPVFLPRIRTTAVQREARTAGRVPPGVPAQAVATATLPRRAAREMAVLIQPNAAAAASVVPDIRSFTVWTGTSRRSTTSPVRAGLVEPIRSDVPTELRPSSDAVVPAPVQREIPLPPIPAGRAGLILRASGSVPLQIPGQAMPGGASGEPASVIALSASRPDPDRILEVPAGYYVIYPTGSERTGPATSNQLEAPGRDRAVSNAAVKQPSPVTDQRPYRDGRNDGPRAPALPATTPARGDQVHSHAVQGSSVDRTNKPAPREMTAGTSAAGDVVQDRTIRTPMGIIHERTNSDGTITLTYPRDGQFDIVVVQSAAPEEAGDLSGLLSGKPIRTVFLQVGAAREWILQYCLPDRSETGARQSGMVVSLGSPAPLKAPYVLEAQLPPATEWRGRTHQVFHGVIGRAGKWEQLRAVTRGEGPARLMEYLGRWVFRPATAGNETKEVEVLLIIPADPAD